MSPVLGTLNCQDVRLSMCKILLRLITKVTVIKKIIHTYIKRPVRARSSIFGLPAYVVLALGLTAQHMPVIFYFKHTFKL